MKTEIRTIGLIAGNGKFPIIFARAAKSQGIKVVAAAVHGDTSFFLRFVVDQIQWFKVGEMEKLFDFFSGQDIKKLIMAGQVNPENLFDEKVEMDEVTQSLFDALKDRKADTIFGAVADQLSSRGMELLDSTFLLDAFLAPQGTLTRRGPSLDELEDIRFGKLIAKSMGALDVGQTVVVKDKAIVAIEAMEGTDRCILRGGQIARQGAVVVKMSKPKQDLRFDVPVVGPRTMKNLIQAGVGCLAIEAGKTIMIDKETCLKMANQAEISIVSS